MLEINAEGTVHRISSAVSMTGSNVIIVTSSSQAFSYLHHYTPTMMSYYFHFDYDIISLPKTFERMWEYETIIWHSIPDMVGLNDALSCCWCDECTNGTIY